MSTVEGSSPPVRGPSRAFVVLALVVATVGLGWAYAPSFATLEKIARVLQTPVQDFFGPEEPDQGGAGAKRIMHRLSLLSPDEIDWVDQIIATALRRPSRD